MSAVVLRGDAAHLPLSDESVDLVCTSPPYFGLRSYTDDGEVYDGQIGAEYTPWQYLEALWRCTAEWMRVLKPGGSIFVNLGDKYSTYTGANWGNGRSLDGHRGQRKVPDGGPVNAPDVYGIPFKSLMGLPWRYALGCIDDLGLILRAEIIWSKANGMPESATDRVRRSHEQVFHFVKEPRGYFTAIDEIREPHLMKPQRRPNGHKMRQALGVLPAQTYSTSARDEVGIDGHPLGKMPGSVWKIVEVEHPVRVVLRALMAGTITIEEAERLLAPEQEGSADTVWEIASQPLTVPSGLGADHFAAFPCELPRRIILGWSPPGICTACNEGRRPVVQRGAVGRERADAGDGGRGLRGLPGYTDIARTPWAEDVGRTIAGYACRCTPHTDHPGTGEPSGPCGRHAAAVADGTYENVGAKWGGKSGLGDRPRVGPWREYHIEDWTPPPHSPGARSRSVRRDRDYRPRRRCLWPHRHHRGPLRRLLPPSPLADHGPRRACPCPRRPQAPARDRWPSLAVRLGGQLTLHLVPVSYRDACRFTAMWHRHHAPPAA